MKNRDQEEQQNAESQAESTEAPNGAAPADLDFESMDLSVETVEERISPSETNVFDK